jgi:hypothetical protein|tara:strand:+ start:1806 stop:2033 length:228 start_codon:yes stop_codon:yes gene_type:complete
MAGQSNDIAQVVQIVNELEDLDEISNVISLFLYSTHIFPGSDQFEDVMDNFNALINENLKLMTVKKLKEHLDEYE